MVIACNATADQCGAWNAWASGLSIDKTNTIRKHGWLAMHHVLHVEQNFV